MSECLSIPYLLPSELTHRDVAELLEYCFEDLGCARSPPEEETTNQFRYTTEETDWRQVTGSSIEEATQALERAGCGSIRFWYDDLNVGLQINLDAPDRPIESSVALSIDEWYTRPWWDSEPALIYEFVLELYDYLSPLYIYGDTYLDEASLSREGVKNGQLEDLFWVNGYGPEMTERLGRDRLLNAPAWRIDECDDGGVFLWISPLPLSESRNQRYDAVTEYLDLA